MKIKSKFKNTLLAGVAGLTLTACGGGGGGGAAGVIDNFVDTDLTNLSGSASLVSSYSNLLSDFQSVISSGDISAIQGVITGPDQQDIDQANTLLTQLETAKNLWDQTEQLIEAQTDSEKYKIYNSNSFKEAHAAMIYLQNYVKPVIQKVANGNTITLADYNLVDKASRANEIIEQEKNSTSSDYANTKKIKSVNTVNNDTDVSTDTTGTSTVSYTDWVAVNAGGGSETRNKITTTPNIRTTVTTRCTFQRTTFLNNSTSDGPETCSVLNTTTTDLDPTVVTEAETREGENPVTATVDLEPTVTTVTEVSADYTETTYTDASETTTETDEGSATTNTANRDVTVTTNNGDNTSTVVVTRYVDTTVTTPITTKVYRTRHYTDTVKRDTRTVTTTVPRQQLTYKDGTTEIVNGSATVTNSDWTTTQISESQRSENILISETTANQVVTTSDSGTQLSSQLVSNTYTDNDINLGTKTADLSTTVADHQTTEYNNSTGLNTINAADAYAKGWTGEGAVLGVIDTWQQTDHPDLDGKYEWYNDYTRYDTTVADKGNQQVHGTHVAGIIAAKNNGSGTQGVAFDSTLVGANIDYHGNGGISKNNAQLALHDMAELKAPVSEGGKNMNIVAVNMSFNNEVSYLTDKGNYNVTELGDGTYHAPKVIERITNNGYGDAKYWRHATDNDIVLVNSAGNSQYIGNYVPADPGLWATETDSSGNLILGGKMIIVGNWTGTGVSGNQAGHVCLNVDLVNNKCNDTHKISDFYILAPGTNINSTVPTNIDSDGYMTMSGTSMSAPHVTGAMGIIHQMWPHMKGENLTKLLLNTADKNLLNYDVNVHGQGLLDLDAATEPYGAVGIPLTGRTNGPVINLTGMTFSSGAYVPSNLLNLQVMVLDGFERDYYVNLGNSFAVQDKRKTSDIDAAMNGYTYLPFQQSYGNFAQGGQYDLGFMNFGFYTGEGGNGDWSTNIGKNFELSKKLKLKTTVGTMSEQETWLGNDSSGALAVGDNNNTNFAQIGATYELGNGAVSLDYGIGKTDVNTVSNSLIKSVDNVQTESLKLGYDYKLDNKKWGATISMPSKIKSGTMHLDVPSARTIDGDVINTDISSNLAGGKQELNYGIYYGKEKLGEMDSAFNFKAEYRQNIAGVDGNNGVNIGFNYIKKLHTNCKFLWMKNPKCFTKDKNGKEVLKADIYDKNKTDKPVIATAYKK